MALQIAVEAEIAEDVEGVIDVLESAAELVAAVAPLGKMFFENLAPLFSAHLAAISRSCSNGWRA